MTNPRTNPMTIPDKWREVYREALRVRSTDYDSRIECELIEELVIALRNYAIRDADANRLQAQVNEMALEIQRIKLDEED